MCLLGLCTWRSKGDLWTQFSPSTVCGSRWPDWVFRLGSQGPSLKSALATLLKFYLCYSFANVIICVCVSVEWTDGKNGKGPLNTLYAWPAWKPNLFRSTNSDRLIWCPFPWQIGWYCLSSWSLVSVIHCGRLIPHWPSLCFSPAVCALCCLVLERTQREQDLVLGLKFTWAGLISKHKTRDSSWVEVPNCYAPPSPPMSQGFSV